MARTSQRRARARGTHPQDGSPQMGLFHSSLLEARNGPLALIGANRRFPMAERWQGVREVLAVSYRPNATRIQAVRRHDHTNRSWQMEDGNTPRVRGGGGLERLQEREERDVNADPSNVIDGPAREGSISTRGNQPLARDLGRGQRPERPLPARPRPRAGCHRLRTSPWPPAGVGCREAGPEALRSDPPATAYSKVTTPPLGICSAACKSWSPRSARKEADGRPSPLRR